MGVLRGGRTGAPYTQQTQAYTHGGLCLKHLNETHSMTLGKRWNPFMAGALPRTPLCEAELKMLLQIC